MGVVAVKAYGLPTPPVAKRWIDLFVNGIDGMPSAMRSFRRPRSVITPDAIRLAAAMLFTERGFSATSLRDIADSDPAVVIRQFASKEKLFLEVLTLPEGFQGLVEGPLDTLGRGIPAAAARSRRRRPAPLWHLAQRTGPPRGPPVPGEVDDPRHHRSAMPAVHAIPAVCAARPGIVTYTRHPRDRRAELHEVSRQREG